MNDLRGYPEHWPKHYNACNEPCDMASGPCACGAWHTLDEWKKEIEQYGLNQSHPEDLVTAWNNYSDAMSQRFVLKLIDSGLKQLTDYSKCVTHVTRFKHDKLPELTVMAWGVLLDCLAGQLSDTLVNFELGYFGRIGVTCAFRKGTGSYIEITVDLPANT
jgi:hypothetical protein